MTKIKDVASAAGVSPSSVSRALTGHPSVSPQLRAHVQSIAESLNYRPNAVARSLRTTGTRTIGLVVSDLLNPFFTELARAVEDTARRAGFSVIVGNADEDPEQQDHYVRILLERQVDGLIVVPTAETSPLLHEAAVRGDHLVLVDRPAADVDAPTVLADGTEAINALVDHLVATGRQDLAIITGPDEAGSSRQRLSAFRDALARHGRPLPPSRVRHGDFRRASGWSAAAALLGGPTIPDAVFVANGSMALGALEYLAEHRDEAPPVPDALAVAVFDDLPWFSLLRPTLTAIEQPTAALGERAVTMLLDRIAGRQVSDERLSCTLRLRESTRGARGDVP